MLAYLFWHRPEPGADREEYERAQERFHRSLAQRPPDGFRASLALHVSELSWLSGEGPGYEDWYVVEDWTALGVLRQAAVGQAHSRAHERAATHSRQGAGAVYRLLDGQLRALAGSTAVWVQPDRGQDTDDMAAMLLDGASAGTLWQRELVLGPAPEYCLLAEAPPAGVAGCPRTGAHIRSRVKRCGTSTKTSEGPSGPLLAWLHMQVPARRPRA